MIANTLWVWSLLLVLPRGILANPLSSDALSNDINIQHVEASLGSRQDSTDHVEKSRQVEYWPGLSPLYERQVTPGPGALLCDKNTNCTDGSCCSKDGICGYGPTFCGAGNCTSNCNATAMCGIYSEGGNKKCGMNTCCSWGGWCGTTTAHCIGPDKFSPCQQGFGSCQMISPPSCGVNSGTASGRTIGYYQGANVRSRACNKIYPHQINITGYTHLYFAFASIDPSTFQIVPASSDDIALYSEFTALKSSKLQTWIAVGGFDFSDKGPTRHTWSILCSDAKLRQQFITSVISFLDTYGFQGIDLDWEYPGDADRGGVPEDTQNFVLLVKELSQAFAGKYGLSLTLAPDYWYLRWFDAKAMEPYVNWFGFMSYDLHGAFDSSVKTLTKTIRGQADIREINNDTMPLWYDGLNPAKINFGLAWYGRGYTLADPSCNTMGCGYSGPSKPGKCTVNEGVMSLIEIQDKIKETGAKPKLNMDAFMKELTWNDQWIGYDDEETIQLKKNYASASCFGGTMAWSVDFHSGVGDSANQPKSSDGTCGAKANPIGATCKDSGFGDCCSGTGWCGSDDSHCGSGCQTTWGTCTMGGVTTDGTCGVGNNGYTCGNFPAGSCCSASGFCGSGDSFCGKGCQSGCFNAVTPKMALNTNFPDPSLVLDPSTGHYYAFATAGNGHQIQVAAKFRDEASWKTLDLEPMTSVGSWAEYHDIWAPDVQNLANHSWVMYYSAPATKDKTKHCVGAATSTDVSGPYTPRNEYIACDLTAGGAIDPSGFYDIASNTRWVVYKVDGNSLGGGGGPCGNANGKHPTPIMLQQVDLDGYTMIGKPITILDRGTADGPLIEAPNLVYENGVYILFFSSNCYSTTLYDISYATSTTLKGPYKKSTAPLLVTGNFSLTAPGGASSNGHGHMVFHARCTATGTDRCMFESDYKVENGAVIFSK